MRMAPDKGLRDSGCVSIPGHGQQTSSYCRIPFEYSTKPSRTHTCTGMHTCIHMHTHACMCTRTHAYTKAYAHTHAHVRIPLDWAPPACMLLFPFSEEKLAMGEQPALFPFASLSSLTSAAMLICKFLATGELLTKAHPGV